MPERKDLVFQNISRERYRELYNFCRQYEEKKSKLNEIYSLSSPPAGEPVSGGLPGKTTENKAIKAIQYREDIDMITECLNAAGRRFGNWMIKALFENVCHGVRFYNLEIYTTKENFYEARRVFFMLLDSKKR